MHLSGLDDEDVTRTGFPLLPIDGPAAAPGWSLHQIDRHGHGSLICSYERVGHSMKRQVLLCDDVH